MRISKGVERAYREIYSEFSHCYQDCDALCFTLGVDDRPPGRFEEFRLALLADPEAAKEFNPQPPSRKRLAWQAARKAACSEETRFWRRELKAARPGKFLSVLEAEKAKVTDLPGTHKTTWVFVRYRGKTLNLGVFEWVVGNKAPYTKFSKAKSRTGFYQ